MKTLLMVVLIAAGILYAASRAPESNAIAAESTPPAEVTVHRGTPSPAPVQTQATPASVVPTVAHAERPDRRWSYMQGVGWIEHRADVSAMQSLGLGGGGGPVATPPRSSAASQKIMDQWGWKDQRAK